MPTTMTKQSDLHRTAELISYTKNLQVLSHKGVNSFILTTCHTIIKDEPGLTTKLEQTYFQLLKSICNTTTYNIIMPRKHDTISATL